MKTDKNEIYTLVDEEYLSKFSFNHQAFMKDYYYKYYYKFCQHYHRKPLSQDEFYTNIGWTLSEDKKAISKYKVSNRASNK